jgi:hypothetical protein
VYAFIGSCMLLILRVKLQASSHKNALSSRWIPCAFTYVSNFLPNCKNVLQTKLHFLQTKFCVFIGVAANFMQNYMHFLQEKLHFPHQILRVFIPNCTMNLKRRSRAYILRKLTYSYCNLVHLHTKLHVTSTSRQTAMTVLTLVHAL